MSVEEDGDVVAHPGGCNVPPAPGRGQGPDGLSCRAVGPSALRRYGVIGTRSLAVAAALLAALAALAGPASAQTLRERLDRAITVTGVSRAQTGAFAFDLRTGRVVYGLNRSRSLAPASNEKLGVALTALDRLGPSYRIRTQVLGDGTRTGSTWNGRLVLRGFGDPTLTSADLRTLASALRSAGLRRVTGEDRRRRELLRQAAHGERLARVLLQERVAAALGPRRRPRAGRGQDGRQPCAGGGESLQARARRSAGSRSAAARWSTQRPRRRRRSRPSAPARCARSSAG